MKKIKVQGWELTSKKTSHYFVGGQSLELTTQVEVTTPSGLVFSAVCEENVNPDGTTKSLEVYVVSEQALAEIGTTDKVSENGVTVYFS